METASFMPRLNTPNRRRASLLRNHFDLALLVPARPHVARRQRVGAEAVCLSRAFEEAQLDKTPDEENEDAESEQQV